MLSPLPQRPSLLLWSSSSLRKPYVSAQVLTLVKLTAYTREVENPTSMTIGIIMVIIISAQALFQCISAYTCEVVNPRE